MRRNRYAQEFWSQALDLSPAGFILPPTARDGTPNAMNAAWGGISDDKELSMCISTGHKTTANILPARRSP